MVFVTCNVFFFIQYYFRLKFVVSSMMVCICKQEARSMERFIEQFPHIFQHQSSSICALVLPDIFLTHANFFFLTFLQLERGQLLCISPYLVKRRKQHFHHLAQYGIDLILGVNGFIWIGEHVGTKDDMVVDQIDKSEEPNSNPEGSEICEQEDSHTPLEIRQYICRVANAVRVLSTLNFMVTVEVITEIVDLSISQNHEIHDMLGAEFYVLVAEKEVQRRLATKKR